MSSSDETVMNYSYPYFSFLHVAVENSIRNGFITGRLNNCCGETQNNNLSPFILFRGFSPYHLGDSYRFGRVGLKRSPLELSEDLQGPFLYLVQPRPKCE